MSVERRYPHIAASKRKIGAHESIAGGVDTAFERIGAVDGSALQIFTKNNTRWQNKPIEESCARRFIEQAKTFGTDSILAHSSYLINLASPDDILYEKSIAALNDELQRTTLLHIPYLVLHPGAHKDSGVQTGIRRIAAALDRSFSETDGNTMILLEITAGQGSQLGRSFEELAAIMETARNSERLGICFDTCHAFAAGYDFRNEQTYQQTFSRLQELIGLQQVRAIHLNDSKGGLGSHVDRHEHIGRGRLGLQAFDLLLHDSAFVQTPMVLETPKGADLEEDRLNLAVLDGLLGKKR